MMLLVAWKTRMTMCKWKKSHENERPLTEAIFFDIPEAKSNMISRGETT